MANYLKAVHEFEEQGYCVVRGHLDLATLAPVRELVSRYVDARAELLHADGHISSLCQDASFESRWARLRAQVDDSGPTGPIGSTSNWGVPSPMGELLLAEPVHALYRKAELTKLASMLLNASDVYGCGNYWFRPMTCDDSQGHYPLHQDSYFYGGEVSPPERCDILSVWWGCLTRLLAMAWLTRIPLVPVDATTGALRLVPGSHRLGKLPMEFGNWQSGDWVQPMDEIAQKYGATITSEPMEVGDVLCFHNLALHGSGEHSRSDFVRWALDLRYERAPDPSRYSQGKQYYQQYPSFLCHRKDDDDTGGKLAAERRRELVSWQEWRQMWSAAGAVVGEDEQEEDVVRNAAKHKPRL